MKQLTKKQKIRVLDKMIELQKVDKYEEGLCKMYDRALQSLNIDEGKLEYDKWTSGFPELNKAIEKAIERTGGGAFMHYKGSWNPPRVHLLQRVLKQIREN